MLAKQFKVEDSKNQGEDKRDCLCGGRLREADLCLCNKVENYRNPCIACHHS